MSPCDWWTASAKGEVVFDCNVPLDYACNIGQRGDWAREVLKWAKTEDHTMLISAMAHGEILAVLHNLELRQIADSRKAFPKGPGDFAAGDSQVEVMSRDITHPETMPVGSQNVGATAADPPDPVEQRPTPDGGSTHRHAENSRFQALKATIPEGLDRGASDRTIPVLMEEVEARLRNENRL